MARVSAKRINAFIQHQSPSLFKLLEQHPQLEDYLQDTWNWVRSQRAQAVQDLGPGGATPALRREAKRCATEISLSLLQQELKQMMSPPPASKSFA